MSEVIGTASIVVTPELAPNAQQKLGAEIHKALRNIESQQASAARQATNFGNSQAKAFKQASAGSKGLLSNVNQLRVAFTVLSSVVAGRFLQSVIASRSEFERTQVSFKGLLAVSKSVQSGFETTSQAVTGLTEDIRTLAIQSGADFADLARGSQALITTLGLSREASVVLLEDIANAAAASGAALDSIPRAVRAITQIASKGFLSAEELNQIADVLPTLARGKIFDELAISLKKPVAEIQKLAAEGGRITSAQGLPAIVKVLRDIDGASGALERQLKTLPGALNVIRGTAKAAVQEGFDSLSGAIQDIIDKAGGIEGLQATFSELLEPLDQLASTGLTAFVDTLIEITPELSDLSEAVAELAATLLENDDAIKGAIETFSLLANAVSTVSGAFSRILGFGDTIGDGINSVLTQIPGIGGIFEKEEKKVDKAVKDTNKGIEQRADLLGELASSAQVALDAQKEFGEQMKESATQIEGVISAEGKRLDALEAIAEAIATVKEIEKDLADLRSERVLLIAEQLVEIEEERAELLENIVDLTEDLADADQAVADARQGVLDADIAVTDAERDLADARRDLLEATEPATERELAAARRDILNAELALAEATRNRLEAEEALAKLERRKLNQGKRLAVLGLDNLRTSLANARASAAAIRTVPDEAELRDDLKSAILNEAEAAESLVESKEDLLELEQQGLDITDEVIEAREKVEKAERAVEAAVRARAAADRDVAQALRERVGAQAELTEAQNIELGLAPLVKSQKEDLARLDGQIADALERRAKAQKDVTKAREDAQVAAQELNTQLAILAGTEEAENDGLRDKIELYREIGRIGPAAYAAIQAELSNLQPGTTVETGNQTPVIGGLLDFITNSVDIVQDSLGRYFLRKKSILQNIFKILPGLEQGGIITKPTVAMMGERGLKEVVLPLTKPARAMQLAQQSGFLDMLSKHQQPFFPSALQMAKSSPTMIRTQRSGPSASSRVYDPEVVAQLRALNEKLNKANLGETIDIDITGVGTVDDKLKMRQLSRQVEKAVRRGRR